MRIIDKIFRDKKGNTVIYLILTVGVLLLVGGNIITARPQNSDHTASDLSEEARLERVLSSIKGVGKTEVMISFEEKKENASIFGESRETTQKGREVKGVVIVSEGGKDSKMREKIIRATKAALGVEIHKIEVFERKE